MSIDTRTHDRQRVVEWSKELLTAPFMLLDTETTGLGPDAEIVELAILKSDGTTFVDRLVQCNNPAKLLEKNKGVSAFDIHHIHPDHLIGAPKWDDIHADVLLALGSERLIIYNSGYDWPLIENACNSRTLLMPAPRLIECAMKKYAAFVGDWNQYRGNYQWQKLPAAPNTEAHRAMGDCQSTLYLIKRMAGLL